MALLLFVFSIRLLSFFSRDLYAPTEGLHTVVVPLGMVCEWIETNLLSYRSRRRVQPAIPVPFLRA